VVLDSAGYGPLTISTSVSLICPPGVYAGISVFSGDGITINAGGSDVVILRGLTINNQGTTGNGITFNSGGTLHVENCAVNGFSSGFGIILEAPASMDVKDSIFRGDNTAIAVETPSGTAVVLLDGVLMEGNGISTGGLLAFHRSRVTVRNSLASGNGFGFLGQSSTAQDAELNIENCIASNNIFGIRTVATSTGVARVRVSNSTVTDNSTGLSNNGAPALLLTRGNNTVEGNGSDTSGTIGSYTAK
jgi:hypothetical protein